MKRSEFKQLIRECYQEVISEATFGSLKIGDVFKFPDDPEGNVTTLTKISNTQYKVKGGSGSGTKNSAKKDQKVIKESMLYEAKRIDKMRKIVKDMSATKIDGILVDMQSANAYVLVYDALKSENRKKMESLPLKQAISVAWKLVK